MGHENYLSILKKIALTQSSLLGVFTDFCRMAACALALKTREDEYLAVANRYDREQLMLFSQAFALLTHEMEEQPFSDLLGVTYTELASNTARSRGEFYTPPSISKLMAQLTLDAGNVIEEGKPITLYEPACGSGGIALAIAEEFAPEHVDLLRFTCEDINPVAADMCYINTTLWGIPAHIVLGDTLRMTCENSWKNIHWHRVGEDQRIATQKMLEILTSPPQAPEKKETPDPDPAYPDPTSVTPLSAHKDKSSLFQGEFDFDLGSQLGGQHGI